MSAFLLPADSLSASTYERSQKTSYPRSEELPALSSLENYALKRAGLDPSNIKRWQKGVKWAAALPRIQASWENKFYTQNTAIFQDNVSVTSSGVTVGPESGRIDTDFEDNRIFEIRAVWSLDELLFNRESLSISREARDLYLARIRLRDDLHDAYYQLRAKLTQIQMEPELLKDPLEGLTIEQLMDRLNSLTGGEFKRLLRH